MKADADRDVRIFERGAPHAVGRAVAPADHAGLVGAVVDGASGGVGCIDGNDIVGKRAPRDRESEHDEHRADSKHEELLT